MAEFVIKLADERGRVQEQVQTAATAEELRLRFSHAGYHVFSIRARTGFGGISRRKVKLEPFLIFNQQFVTLIRAGLPILRALDLLAERLTDPKLSSHIRNVRDEVKSGALLSDAFAKQGVFPPIYVTSVLAGERSGSLAEVIERFVTYQKLALSVRKKLLVSLMYPALLIVLVTCLIVFLITEWHRRHARLLAAGLVVTLVLAAGSTLAVFGAHILPWRLVSALQ